MVGTKQTRVKCCQSIRHPYLVCRTLSAQCNHQRPSATMAKFPYFQPLDFGFKHVYDMVGTQQTRVKCCQSIRHAYLFCRTLSGQCNNQCNHQRPSSTMAKFPYFQQLDIGFKHVYDMVGTKQTRAKCCQSIRHAYLVCRTLSAKCNRQRPSATMAKFPYFQPLDFGFKHVYDMGGTQQTRVKCCQSIRHAYIVCRTLSAQCNHQRPSATMAKFPYFQQLDIGFKQLYGMIGTQQSRVKCCQSIRHAYLVCRTLSAQCNHQRPSATMAKFPYFQQLDMGFKHVYDMVGTKQTRAKCCQSIRHAYIVCRTLSAQCNHQRPGATMAKFPYFQRLNIGFKHVYDMVGTKQTRVKCCQSIRHPYLVCRTLSAQCNHQRPSATMAKFPYFQPLDFGFKHVYDMVGTQQTRVRCCQSIRHAYLVCRTLSGQCNHQRPSATMAKFPYFQRLDFGFKHVYDMVGTKQIRAKCCQSIRHAYLVCRTLWAQCNHQRPSATMAKFPYFQRLDFGFKHVYDMGGTQQTRVKCCQSIRHAYIVCRTLSAQCNHQRPSATMAKFPYFYQ